MLAFRFCLSGAFYQNDAGSAIKFPTAALDLRKTIIIMLSFKLGNALMKLTKIINKPGG